MVGQLEGNDIADGGLNPGGVQVGWW